MSNLTKRNPIFPVAVPSKKTDTGRLARTRITNFSHFFVGFVGMPVIMIITNFNLEGLLHWGSLNFLAMPAVGILSGIMTTDFEVQARERLVKHFFTSEEKELLRKAKKKIGLRRRLAMLFHLRSAPTVLLVETDRYNMTHTQAELVRQGLGYAIEIETVDAMKTWDSALESVVPESVRESVALAAVSRDAKYLANKIREETKTREAWRHENAEYLRYRRQRGIPVTVGEDVDSNADYECSCCAF